MDNELIKLLDNFLEDLDKNLIEYKELKSSILNDQQLLNKIEKLHNTDKYSNEYKALKNQLFEIDKYRKYLEYESNLNLLAISLTNKLKSITKADFNENN